ncbi:hypothetical protein Tco_0873420 [Tanacetum coccineum]|uniref:Reverse transcriptase domain-containing protein n=1 Tax=Tanacetum coccineum TaxID=301880 RepID=A0ABQ5BMW2_9ASTR
MSEAKGARSGISRPCKNEIYANAQFVLPDGVEDFVVPYFMAGIGESSLIGPELIQETTDKVVLIKEKLKVAGDRQKSYANNRRKPVEFEVGDRVMLKVSPWKGVIRFGKRLSWHQVAHLEDYQELSRVGDLVLLVEVKEYQLVKTIVDFPQKIQIEVMRLTHMIHLSNDSLVSSSFGRQQLRLVMSKILVKRELSETKLTLWRQSDLSADRENQGDTFVTPEKSKGSGEAQVEQIVPYIEKELQRVSSDLEDRLKECKLKWRLKHKGDKFDLDALLASKIGVERRWKKLQEMHWRLNLTTHSSKIN